MRKYVGNTMMVSLALLLGCSQAQQRSCPGPRYYQGGAVVSAPPGSAGSPAAPPYRTDGPGMLPRPVSPQMRLPPARVSPPSELGPEVSHMRVYARRGAVTPPANVAMSKTPRSAPPQPVLPSAPTKAPPAQPIPEVVLLGVGEEPTQGAPGAPVMRTVSTGRKPEAALLAPELQQATTALEPLPTQPVNPSFAHAPDYGWLTGELEHIRAKNIWRLRYAPADQEDRYGGTVQLVRESLPAGCKSGQVVRVEGQIVNPDAGPRPPYWVRSFQLLKEAPPEQE